MITPNLSFVILFVDDPLKSKDFYSKILGLAPIEEAPTFVLFAMKNGGMLGLWSRTTALPEVVASPGASEICFLENEIDDIYHEWCALKVPMLQEAKAFEGGYGFVAHDLDGHRIRVMRMDQGK